jgi:hypothetical protein
LSNSEYEDFGRKASIIIKVSMARHQIKAPELARLLNETGDSITPQQINNRLFKCNYKASWFIKVLTILGENEIQL